MRMELSKFGVPIVLFNPGDHPGETPLCAGQDRNYDIMDREVEAIEDVDTFRGYYQKCRWDRIIAACCMDTSFLCNFVTFFLSFFLLHFTFFSSYFIFLYFV